MLRSNVMRFLSATAVAYAGVSATTARAQNFAVDNSLAVAAQDESVLARPRADYDEQGIALSSFRLYPTITGSTTYDSNVYNSDTLKRSDVSFLLTPKIDARSQWSQNSLDFTAGGAFQRYAKLTSENNDQYNVGADGRLDITQAIALSLGASYARRTEPRGTFGDVLIGGEPSRYNDAMAKAAASFQLADLKLTTTGSVEDYKYLPIRSDGQSIVQRYRDRVEADGTLRADYAIGPGLRVFGTGTYDNQNYREKINGVDQNSHGYAMLGGFNFGLTHLISGEVGLGYISQKYAQTGVGTVAGINYEAKLTWNPTTLMTVTANASKALQQSPFLNQKGILEDQFGLQLDYELLRRLILSLQGSGVLDQYKGIDRRDRLYVGTFTIRYLANRFAEAGLVFNARHQGTSTDLGRKYSGRSVTFSVTLKG